MRFSFRRLGFRTRSYSRPASASRKLSFERLSPRELMAAELGEATQVADVLGATAGQPAPITAETSTADATPLWGDIGGGELTVLSYGYGGYGFIPPEIVQHSNSESTPGMWTFRGTVADDTSVSGLYVTFGGLLQGSYTMTRTDGTFEFIHLFSPETSGFVTAYVTDRDGINSQLVTWYVG
jgi:hypothetical protein